jgi:hypothetical protein
LIFHIILYSLYFVKNKNLLCCNRTMWNYGFIFYFILKLKSLYPYGQFNFLMKINKYHLTSPHLVGTENNINRCSNLSFYWGLICRGHSTVPLQAIYIKKLNIKSKSCLWSHQRQFFDLKIIFFNIKGSWGTVKRPPGIITPKFICKIK